MLQSNQQWTQSNNTLKSLTPKPYAAEDDFLNVLLESQTPHVQPSSTSNTEVNHIHGSGTSPTLDKVSATSWQGQEFVLPQDIEQRTIPTTPPQRPKNRWQQARDYRLQVHESPQIDPRTDYTIAQVEAAAEAWVQRLIAAMSNTQNVKDTLHSHHRRLFLPENRDDKLIEASCREIFVALVDRCKHGFRGPPQFNKALRANGPLEPDRTARCEERLLNVVKVLAWDKRACKDVLYEDWRIKLLVNHPLTYDKEKDAQKGSNDQRRKKQLQERETVERTQEELRALRLTGLQKGLFVDGVFPSGPAVSHAQPLDQGGWQHDWTYHDHGNVVNGNTSHGMGKRQMMEDDDNDAKRRRL